MKPQLTPLAIALKEVGYEEKPAGSNRTKYGKHIGIDGVPWCGLFVSYCYDKSGRTIKGAGLRLGFMGCQYAMAHVSKWGAVTKDPQPGDVVFFDWNRDGRYDHTGLFIEWIDANKTRFRSVEGNTAQGNDSNGGKVMIRERSVAVSVFVRVR